VAAGDAAVEPVGGHRDHEERGRPVVVTLEIDGVEQHDERYRRNPRQRELIGKPHR